MNKAAARKLAESETVSIGKLRQMIEEKRGSIGMSAVNKSFTIEQALDIYAAALGNRSDDEIPKAWRPDPYSRSGKMKPSGDSLIVTNILRDCA